MPSVPSAWTQEDSDDLGRAEVRRMMLPRSMLAWDQDALDEFEERAAIREYLGKMPRARAEAAAERDVRAMWEARPSAPATGAAVRPRAPRGERPPGSGPAPQR